MHYLYFITSDNIGTPLERHTSRVVFKIGLIFNKDLKKKKNRCKTHIRKVHPFYINQYLKIPHFQYQFNNNQMHTQTLN